MGPRRLQGPVPIPSPPFLPSRLTAFVLKILSLAQEQVGGSPEKLQETAKWLLLQQLADGSFHDPHPVIHRGMQVQGWEAGPRSTGGKALPAPPPPGRRLLFSPLQPGGLSGK